MSDTQWTDVGTVEALKQKSLQEVNCGTRSPSLISTFVTSGICNHVGGPLGTGTLDDYVVCPWHYLGKFHRETGARRGGI